MNENENVVKTYEVIPARNPQSVVSLVLSIIGFILSPLMILQILGLIFGIRGLKSEKRGISIAGIVISSIGILLGIVVIVSIIAFSSFGSVLQNAREKADIQISTEIQQAIVSYINDSKDIDLEFGENQVKSVDEIIDSLQETIIVDGVEYGPYLLKEDDFYLPNSDSVDGWSISIDKSKGAILVEPSVDGDKVDIIE